MPPSPALKYSPRREIKSDSKHRRGHSFDSGISLKAKDDDLILFNEMQMREREEFLLRSNDDFEDCLSKLRCFSDYKLDINIPIHGENSGLLNADSGKNDYDWLLTPPDTPLFPSLDDDEPPPTNLSTSSRVERNQRPTRSSASPHRRSPSPRPGSSTLQSRGRTSSAPYSGLSPVLSSSATSRSVTPTPRSVTPTPRRLSSSSSGWTSSSGIRGTSPIKGTRGDSASPKLRGWQSNIPGFSSDAPPNLRTSVLERPASYSRGSSPASRNGKESYSRHGRESMSPTASRSVSSWHSHDRDHFSSHSKGSIASSGDDDVESLQSVSVGISIGPRVVKNGSLINNRTMAHSKRVSRTPSPSSAPRRSFDSALRHMDHRKTPQNMFRPLMSSVPPSSFFEGKGNTLHRPIFSRNLSLATKSNASCDLAANVTATIEDMDHDHAYLDPERMKVSGVESCLHEEMPLFEKMEEIRVDANPEQFSIHDGVDGRTRKEIELECQNSMDLFETVPDTSYEPLFVVDHPVLDSDERISICSICGKNFHTEKAGSGDTELCQQCDFKDDLSSEVSAKTSQLSAEVEDSRSKMVHAVNVACEEAYLNVSILESSEEADYKTSLVIQSARNPEHKPQEGVVVQLRTIGKESKVDKEFDIRQTIESLRSISEYKFKPSTSFSPSSSLRSDGSEGTGLSGLLKKSCSTKGAVLQRRIFTASNISCTESSCAKERPSTMQLDHSRNVSVASSIDLLNAVKVSYSCSSSTASSLDLGSSRKAEAQLQKLLSSGKDAVTSLKNDSNLEPHDSVFLSTGDLQTHSHVEENHELLGCYSSGEISSVNDECCKLIEDLDGSTLATTSIDTTGHEHDDYAMGCSVVDVSLSKSSVCSQNSRLSAPTADSQTDLASMLHKISDTLQTNRENIKKTETPVDILFAVGTADESASSDTNTCESSVTRDEIENFDGLECSQLNCSELQNPINDTESSHTRSASLMSEKNISVSFDELNNTDTHVDKRIHEESTVTVENSGQKSRSLTLEEATDTILFCSKIIQDLANKAAAIGAEKEQTFTSEVPRPTVTVLPKPVSEPKTQNRTLTKAASKSQKVITKSSEAASKLLTEPVTDVKVKESHHKQVHHEIDSAKPKCSCIVM